MVAAATLGSRVRTWWAGNLTPEPGRVVLGQRRVYILPTRLGWMFGATLAILLAGSINYALQLGFALTFLLAGVGLAAMVHTTRNLARLALSAGRAEPVFAGESAQFRLYLENPSRHDRPAILVRHAGSGSQVVVDLAASSTAEVTLGVPAPRRGWLALARVTLETRFPLGLFRAWSTVVPEARCLVYPRPERAPLPGSAPADDAGAQRPQSRGSEDFSGLRAYQLQDSPRHVAWKAAARSGELLTKQFAGATGAELWLDLADAPAALGLEARLSRLAGWILAAEQAGLRYGLRLPSLEREPDLGEVHRSACLQALALHALA
ncbi:MAG: DUF58 domain-containing protein [Burkholderiales bacterium]